MNESPFLGRILTWLNQRLAPPGVTIEADTELFATGMVDSIRILHLIAWTERETGRVIADEDIRMDYFATARRIALTFDGA